MIVGLTIIGIRSLSRLNFQEKKNKARGATDTIFRIFQEAISQPTRGKMIWPRDQATQMTQMTKPLFLMLEISQRMFMGD